MSDNTALGDRMKRYEDAVGPVLLRRTPVIIRVDGKAFHTFTRQITTQVEPETQYHFSDTFHHIMMMVSAFLVHKIQNAMIAYTQSDEISILLNDWKTHETSQWFDGKTQKIVSVSAAMAASAFNYYWPKHFPYLAPEDVDDLAAFDSRAFNVPREDVDNYFLWRQRDAMRNSVNFIARKFCSHKSLDGLNGLEVKNKLRNEHGVVWDGYPLWEQRGACVYRNQNRIDMPSAVYVRDDNIPVFSDNREYINQFLREKEEG